MREAGNGGCETPPKGRRRILSTPEKVLVRKENGVGWITLNRPEVLNALDIDLLKKLYSTLRDLEKDEEVRCVVISGAGRAFSAGADLQAVKARQSQGESPVADPLRELLNPIVSKMRSMDKPIIAMVNGVAAGAGMSLALASDLRVMSEEARFVEAFAKVGLPPDSGAAFFMPRLLGLAKAMELAFTGEGMDARECERLGVVNKVVSQGQLENETRTLAEKLAKGPKGMGLAKRAINRALSTDFEGALEFEAWMQDVARSSLDHKEGVSAFTEKRSPRFQGK